MRGTEKADDAVRMGPDVTPDDLREFVKRRVEEPVEVQVERFGRERTVKAYNFSTHKVDMGALRTVAPGLHNDRYIIPYQVPGVWAYIVRLLPKELDESELLVYSRTSESYKAFPNFRRIASEADDQTLRQALEVVVDGSQ